MTTQESPDFRSEFRHAHTTRHYDLATQDWLPVRMNDGKVEAVSLGHLLTNCHEIVDIAVSEPLARAATRRWLVALTSMILTRHGPPDQAAWTKRMNSNSGFTADEVGQLLEQQGEYLWLYHPRTPFLQDRRLLTSPAAREGWRTSSDELIPQTPGDNARAWAIKHGDPGYRAGIPLPELPTALIRRWYYGLPGNGGRDTIGAVFCSSTTEAAPMTHLFRLSQSSLFATLLANISRSIVTGSAAPVTGPAWADPQYPRQHGDPLYLYTTTATSALIGPTKAEVVRDILRAGTYLENTKIAESSNKEATFEARDAAKDFDPHRIRRPDNARGKPQSDVRLRAGDPPLRRIDELRRNLVEHHENTSRGIARSADLFLPHASDAEHFELLLAEVAGSSSSRQWSATRTLLVPAFWFNPEWSNAELLDNLLAAAYAMPRGVVPELKRAIAGVFAERRDKRTLGIAVSRSAEILWSGQAEEIVNRALSRAAAANVDPSQIEAEEIDRMWQAAINAAEQALAPYRNNLRSVGDVVKAIETIKAARPLKAKEPSEPQHN